VGPLSSYLRLKAVSPIGIVDAYDFLDRFIRFDIWVKLR
jgi:hypothetical protein